MQQYLNLLEDILTNGIEKTDRTGTGTLSLPFKQLQFDLSKGLPVVTTKKIHLKSVVHELIWILSGSTNIKYLTDNKVTIWNEWADEKGELGPVYGNQWRKWKKYVDTGVTWSGYNRSFPFLNEPSKSIFEIEEIDQIQNLVDTIKKTPDSRRLMVNAWNVADLDEMRLPPCHYGFQVIITGHKLNLQWNQRSVDCFLGLPFNIAFYAILTHMLSQVTGYEPGILSVVTGDIHIYKNHLEQTKLQLTREPLPLPILKLNPDIKNIFDFKYEDIQIEDYKFHPAIKASVAI